jgi:legumain
MNFRTLAIFLTLIIACSCAHWAVLVAGSNTWSNYRHQSDIFHTYQVLLKKGFDPNKILVFAYNDIANSPSNKFPGKVFNKPTNSAPGVDVYAGVKIDYQGKDVDPAVFLAVLEGNKAAVAGKGTGRVLECTPDDNVFVFFSDHGAANLIAFPSAYLYADALLATLKKITGKFHQFTFYLETC